MKGRNKRKVKKKVLKKRKIKTQRKVNGEYKPIDLQKVIAFKFKNLNGFILCIVYLLKIIRSNMADSTVQALNQDP